MDTERRHFVTCPKGRSGLIVLALGLWLTGSAVRVYADPTYKEFDVHGAAGTWAQVIDGRGDVGGTYSDSDQISHGFIRARGGAIMTFDPQGSYRTDVLGINREGSLVGDYERCDGCGVYGAFLRTPDGTITEFNAQDSVDTVAEAINNKGTIVGYFVSIYGELAYGFIRTSSGSITGFGIPGSDSTYAVDINGQGAVTGYWLDSSSNEHGFLRTADGKIVKFDVKAAKSTIPSAIDNRGTITGRYIDWDFSQHGFVRLPNGRIDTFDVPGSKRTIASDLAGVPPAGTELAGYSADFKEHVVGFLRVARGSFTTFEAPDAGGGAYQGTWPQSVNRKGSIVGHYTDSAGAAHGFLRIP